MWRLLEDPKAVGESIVWVCLSPERVRIYIDESLGTSISREAFVMGASLRMALSVRRSIHAQASVACSQTVLSLSLLTNSSGYSSSSRSGS
jgi:hypothetical protein